MSSVRGDLLRIVLSLILCVCMCVYSEQDELMRQVEASVSEQERKELQREQERLLLKMERKGEQISKLYKHKTQVGTCAKKKKVQIMYNHAAKARICFVINVLYPFLSLV